MSEKKKPELKVTLHEHFYINPEQGWFWIVTNIYGTEITSHKTYARMASAKRGAIRSLTNLGLAAKYQLVFEVDK